MGNNVPNNRVIKLERYMFHGKELSEGEALKYPVVAAGEGLQEENVGYVFESHEDFAKWSQETKHAEKVAEALQSIEKIKAYEKKDNSAAKERQGVLAKRVLEDLQELSQRTGVPLESPELLMKASFDSEPLEGKIFNHSAIIFELSGGGGAGWPSFGIPYPDLNWFQWGNRAVSVRVSGLAILTDDTWYRGQWFVMFGFFWVLFELGGFSFRAEAMWS
jgi:hypothetical protein